MKESTVNSRYSILERWGGGTRGLLRTKMKIFRDSKSSSFGAGVLIGIVQKGLVKRVPENKSLTLDFIEFDLSSIQVIKSQL